MTYRRTGVSVEYLPSLTFLEWSSDKAIMCGLHRNYCKIEDVLVQRRPESKASIDFWGKSGCQLHWLVSSKCKTPLPNPRKFMAEFFYSFEALLPSAWSSTVVMFLPLHTFSALSWHKQFNASVQILHTRGLAASQCLCSGYDCGSQTRCSACRIELCCLLQPPLLRTAQKKTTGICCNLLMRT